MSLPSEGYAYNYAKFLVEKYPEVYRMPEDGSDPVTCSLVEDVFDL